MASAAVADTHALLYHTSSRPLGRRATAHFAACELRQATIHVPVAVVWEVAVLSRAGRITLQKPLREYFAYVFSNPSYQPLDLTAEQVYDASELGFTRDPFDGLIVAAARALHLPLITRDESIRASGTVKVLW